MLERSPLSNQVASVVESAAAHCGALVLRDVLLDFHTTTTLCRFAWIDRFGILAIDVEEWPGAKVDGTASSRTWRASVPGARSRRFANPLLEARRRQGLLDGMLVACGRRLEPGYLQALVVFIGADLTALRLDPASASLVVDAKTLDGYLRSRSDFEPNFGILEAHEVADLQSLLRALDRSDDPEATGRHAGLVHAPGRWLPWPRRGTSVAVSDSHIGRAPIAARIAEAAAGNVAPARRSALPLLLVVLAAVLALASTTYGGRAILATWVQAVRGAIASVGGPAFTSQPRPAHDVEAAIAAFRQGAPEIAARAVAIHAPVVTSTGDTTNYTWEYAELDDTGAGFRTFTLTYDASGMLVGATSD